MIDQTKKVERNVSQMLLDSIIVRRGIASKGMNKGKEYATIAIRKKDMWDPSLAQMAEDAGVPCFDYRESE